MVSSCRCNYEMIYIIFRKRISHGTLLSVDPKGSPFEGGVYHGRIVLPNNYPIGAPDFYFLTVFVVSGINF